MEPSPSPSTQSRSSRAMRASVRWAGKRAASLFNVWGKGYRRLAESHGASVAGDALFAVALAGTLFFSVPSTDARENVALYLLLTLAPFAVLGPLLGYLFERSPGAYRAGLALSSIGRAGVAIMSIFVIDSLWLFPLAFTMLVFSRFFGISRSSVLPVVVRDADQLVDANARLARIGVLAGAMVLPFGAAAVALIGAWPALVMAAVAFGIAALTAVQLPPVPKIERPITAGGTARERKRIPRRVRLARFATGGVRFLNGYLLFLVAFAFRDVDAGVLSLSALLAAAGLGYFLAALVAPSVEGYVSEEPMVVAALAILAGAAFIGAQVLSLWVAAILVGAAGFSWGMAKFGFDGMLQVSVAPEHRGRAFTNSETLFQIAWVIGALIPVLPFWPTTLGLASAGVVALIIQVVYVTLVLLPETVRWRRRSSRWSDGDDERGVLDLL